MFTSPLHNLDQPRSQTLSSLPPLVVGRTTTKPGRQRRENLGTRLNLDQSRFIRLSQILAIYLKHSPLITFSQI